jgi:uncharacterized protein (DUF924 family)
MLRPFLLFCKFSILSFRVFEIVKRVPYIHSIFSHEFSFWLSRALTIKGIDYQDPSAPEKLREGSFLHEMSPFWMRYNEEYDDLCQAFAPLVRDAGQHRLPVDEEHKWQSQIDGKMAQLILCDQLSHNCFRGQDEAFQYDDTAQDIARELSMKILSSAETECVANPPNDNNVSQLDGEFNLPYVTFLILKMTHSESLDDHTTALKVVASAE